MLRLQRLFPNHSMSIEPSNPSSLEIHLLGPFRVKGSGQEIEEHHWSRRKPALLVKLLALQAHHQLHREQVMELLWPDLDTEAATNNLHKTIHAARRALEPALKSVSDSHFILTHGQQVHLRAPGKLWIDVEAFEQAAAEALKSSETDLHEKALALYEGDLLIEDPYEDWTAARREHLRALHQDLLVSLSRLFEARGKYQPGIERAKEIVALDPSNEEAHRQLMRLHALNGNRQHAIHQYQQCCEDLLRELDSRPEQATVKLYEQIISGAIQPLVRDTIESPLEQKRAINSIAILPLANAGADVNIEYLSDGITESIINNLSQLSALRIMAWSTVSRYKSREINPQEVGRELGVRAVLTGRVLQLSEQLVVKTELVDTADGSQLWGKQYSLELSDVFAIEGEISREISEQLRLKLTSEEKRRLSKQGTVNATAYRLYLKGRYFWYKRTEAALRKSIEHFNQAIEEDPSYAAAYDGLSDSYALLALRQLIPPKEAFLKAKTAARKALEIDDTLGEAYASLAHVRLHDWDWPGLEEDFKHALRLNPGHAIAYHWYSEYLMAMGRADESIAIVRQAQEMDALAPVLSSALGSAYYCARNYDEAIQALLAGLELNPSHFMLHFRLGHAYIQKNMYHEAIEEMQRAVALSNKSTETLAGLGQAHAAAGMKEEMRKVLDELSALSKERYVSPYHIAKIYAAAGDKEDAFEWLEKACQEHNPDIIDLNVEPSLDTLRSDPRFTDFLQRVGLV
jgi:DNA-binding SARP family transcriptional activator/Tfp pilus assembly protein PilF